MTPDKLPEEIHDTIKAEAKLYDQSYYTHLSQHSHKAPSDHYQAGATAWAPWKVKYDELQAQAQRMADALEALKEGAENHTILFIDKALREWKDGGKEEENREVNPLVLLHNPNKSK